MILKVSQGDDFGSIFKIGKFENEKYIQRPMGLYQGEKGSLDKNLLI